MNEFEEQLTNMEQRLDEMEERIRYLESATFEQEQLIIDNDSRIFTLELDHDL